MISGVGLVKWFVQLRNAAVSMLGLYNTTSHIRQYRYYSTSLDRGYGPSIVLVVSRRTVCSKESWLHRFSGVLGPADNHNQLVGACPC